MNIPNAVSGETHTPYSFTWKHEDDTVIDLTGAVITGSMRNKDTAVDTALTSGLFAITDATAGEFTFTPTTAEVIEGRYDLQLKATIAGADQITQLYEWIIEESIL